MLYSSPCSLVYGMVPFLNAILGTMLPMLCMAKQDNMKWVFSSGKDLPDVHFWGFDSFKCIYPSHKPPAIPLQAHSTVKERVLPAHDSVVAIFQTIPSPPPCLFPYSSVSFQWQYLGVPRQLGQGSRSHSQKRHIRQWNLRCFWHPLQ